MLSNWKSKFNAPVWICNILDQLIEMKASCVKTKKKTKNKENHERNRTAYAKLFLCDSLSRVEYLPQFQSVTNGIGLWSLQ